MRKRERGQAFILVLILLAIGALLVVPTLRLTGTALRNVPLVTGREKAIYAVDAGQEYVLWKLLHDDYGSYFDLEHDTGYLSLDVCGIPVDIVIVMRAVEGTGGFTLATDDVIRPEKTVSPDTIPNDTTETVTYTIRLEQLSDNISHGLEVIYDILPDVYGGSDFVNFSCELSIDGGPWQSIPDPNIEAGPKEWRLRWPASGEFSSDNGSPNYFYGMKDFTARQVKELRFQMQHHFKGEDNDRVHCNWVVLKPWDTVSGPQAPLTVGSPSHPGVCDDDGLVMVDKTSDPDIIQPGVETDIKYSVNMTNQDGFTHQVEEIIDYLPPGFSYNSNSTSGIITDEPVSENVTINGIKRLKLQWVFSPPVSIQAAETVTLTFWARTTKDISGSYYNEALVTTDVPIPQIFQDILDEENWDKYYNNYSWNAGAVTVPTYDSSAGAGGVIVDANMALVFGGISITSYQWR